MNIGIDIDGVITNIDFLGILGKNKPILDKESSNLKVNNFLIRKILYKGIAFYSKHSKLRSDAAKYINLLKDDGNRITIITKRRFAGEETKEGKDIRSLVEVFLIEQGIPYDKIVFSNGTTASIPLFNAGDLETAFTLSFSFDNNNIGSDLIHIYLEGNTDSQLYLSKMTKKGNDTEVRLNIDNNLLEGYENGVRSGNLYNEFKVSGNFFKIPIGDSTLKIIGCSSNNNITIKYNYLYY